MDELISYGTPDPPSGMTRDHVLVAAVLAVMFHSTALSVIIEFLCTPIDLILPVDAWICGLDVRRRIRWPLLKFVPLICIGLNDV